MKTFFLWVVGLGLTFFVGGFLVVLYDSHQRSPEFDPVTFDFSDRRPDGSSENNPDCIFYVPARFWGEFPPGYQNNKMDFFRVLFEFGEMGNPEVIRTDRLVLVDVSKSIGWNRRVDNYLNELKERVPESEYLGLKKFTHELKNGVRDPFIYYLLKGFDGQDVVIKESASGLMDGFYVFRKFNASVEIHYVLKKINIKDIFNADIEITEYVKNLQVSPKSFIKLK